MALLDYLSTTPIHRRRWLEPTIPPPAPAPVTMPEPSMLPNAGPLPAQPIDPKVGTHVPSTAGRLQRILAERATLGRADVSSKVQQTPWGYEVAPPEQSPSRVRQALTGVLHGANIAAQASGGDPLATLAGAATGGISGGASPRLVQAMTRKQEMDRLASEAQTEQGLAMRNAQIYNEQAEPELKLAALQRQIDADAAREADRLRRDEDRDADRELRAGEANLRYKQAETTNKTRQSTLEETIRHNKAMEDRPGAATEEITVAGRKFKVSPSTAARILEDRGKLRAETEIEADLETEAANDHLERRKQADQEISRLRAEREKLTHSSKQLPDGAWGWQEDPRKVDRNVSSVRDIDRQIAEAERESSYRQREADSAFGRARKAKAKGMSGGGPAASSGRTIEGAIDAFKASQKRDPTPAEIERMRKALNR